MESNQDYDKETEEEIIKKGMVVLANQKYQYFIIFMFTQTSTKHQATMLMQYLPDGIDFSIVGQFLQEFYNTTASHQFFIESTERLISHARRFLQAEQEIFVLKIQHKYQINFDLKDENKFASVLANIFPDFTEEEEYERNET